jgi:aspartyl protease family protein
MQAPQGLQTWVRIGLVWLILGGVIFAGFSAVQHWENSRRTQVVLKGNETRWVLEQARDGHFHVEAKVSGPLGSETVEFLIDTGATTTSIPSALARSLGLPTLGQQQFNTANGIVQGSMHSANLSLPGGIELQQLRIAALPHMSNQSLLGMDVLRRFRIVQEGRTLSLSIDRP